MFTGALWLSSLYTWVLFFESNFLSNSRFVSSTILLVLSRIWLGWNLIFHSSFASLQVIMMLAAGHFRIRNALPKPIWTYPFAYISFHTYSIEVTHSTLLKTITASCRKNSRTFLCNWMIAGSFGERVPRRSVCGWRSEEYIGLPSNPRKLPDISRHKLQMEEHACVVGYGFWLSSSCLCFTTFWPKQERTWSFTA